MRKMALVLLAAAGCMAAEATAARAERVQSDWRVNDESQLDALVELEYSYPNGKTPVTSDHQAWQLAKERCQSWGYEDAQVFAPSWGESERSVCPERTVPRGDGAYDTRCFTWYVTRAYQCLGRADETRPPDAKKTSKR